MQTVAMYQVPSACACPGEGWQSTHTQWRDLCGEDPDLYTSSLLAAMALHVICSSEVPVKVWWHCGSAGRTGLCRLGD